MAAGVWLYLLVLRRIAADRYFQVANPAIMVVLTGVATLMAFKLNQVLEYAVRPGVGVGVGVHCMRCSSWSEHLSVVWHVLSHLSCVMTPLLLHPCCVIQVLSAVLAACWFLFMYDNFLGTAAVSHKYYGFCTLPWAAGEPEGAGLLPACRSVLMP